MIKFNATKLAAVALAQSNEQTRYYLCGVCFDGQIAVATDGHLMTAATDTEAENDTDQAIMPVSKKAITALRGKKAEYAVFDNGLLTVIDEFGETLYIEPSVAIDGTFPDWRRIVPLEIGHATLDGFSDIVQRKLADTCKTINGGAYRLTGETNSGHTVLYGSTNEVFSIAMPMRAAFAPHDWVRTELSEAA